MNLKEFIDALELNQEKGEEKKAPFPDNQWVHDEWVQALIFPFQEKTSEFDRFYNAIQHRVLLYPDERDRWHKFLLNEVYDFVFKNNPYKKIDQLKKLIQFLQKEEKEISRFIQDHISLFLTGFIQELGKTKPNDLVSLVEELIFHLNLNLIDPASLDALLNLIHLNIGDNEQFKKLIIQLSGSEIQTIFSSIYHKLPYFGKDSIYNQRLYGLFLKEFLTHCLKKNNAYFWGEFKTFVEQSVPKRAQMYCSMLLLIAQIEDEHAGSIRHETTAGYKIFLLKAMLLSKSSSLNDVMDTKENACILVRTLLTLKCGFLGGNDDENIIEESLLEKLIKLKDNHHGGRSFAALLFYIECLFPAEAKKSEIYTLNRGGNSNSADLLTWYHKSRLKSDSVGNTSVKEILANLSMDEVNSLWNEVSTRFKLVTEKLRESSTNSTDQKWVMIYNDGQKGNEPPELKNNKNNSLLSWTFWSNITAKKPTKGNIEIELSNYYPDKNIGCD